MHTGDRLELSTKQQTLFKKERIADVFPSYYILRVNAFTDVAKDGPDEWMYFLKNEEIQGNVTAKGLKAAGEKLDIMKLPEEERIAYQQYVEGRRWQTSRMRYSVERAEKAEKELEETHTLLLSEREKAEIERRQREAAQKREEEARKQKEEARKQREDLAEAAIAGFMEMGKSREEVRKLLGLD